MPPFALTRLQVTTAVNVTRSPAFNIVPAAGAIEFNAIKSVVGAVRTVRAAARDQQETEHEA